jgi:homoserine dehydrogenase
MSLHKIAVLGLGKVGHLAAELLHDANRSSRHGLFDAAGARRRRR